MNDTKNKNLSGALFKNDKGDNANRPDYKGTFTDGQGNELWLSAWVKKDKNGNSYMSISAKVKEPKQSPPVQAPVEAEEDGLPF